MKVKAQSKFVRGSARKIRHVAALIKGKPAGEALVILSFLPHWGARLLKKTLMSAVANAKNNYKLNGDKLFVSQVLIDGATPFKRIHPRAKGSAFPILKRQSHITLFVEEVQSGTKSSS